MQAIEIEATVDKDHAVHVVLPDDWDVEKVRVILLKSEKADKPIRKERKFGGLEGKIHMADDFDDELPDDFWSL